MSKEEKAARIIGEYDGKKAMLKLASDEMFRNLPTNESGEVIADALLELNEWVDRMQTTIGNTMWEELMKLS